MKRDGGPAFPVPANVLQTYPEKALLAGISMRDYFAAVALAGIAGHISGPEKREGETAPQAHARWSYQVADAMLAERSKP